MVPFHYINMLMMANQLADMAYTVLVVTSKQQLFIFGSIHNALYSGTAQRVNAIALSKLTSIMLISLLGYDYYASWLAINMLRITTVIHETIFT